MVGVDDEGLYMPFWTRVGFECLVILALIMCEVQSLSELYRSDVNFAIVS